MVEDPPALPSTLEVYWRPYCPYCHRLLRALERAQVAVVLHNIWEDDAARQFVASHNRGNETVPTVSLAGVVSTNPAPAALLAEIESNHPHLLRATAPKP